MATPRAFDRRPPPASNTPAAIPPTEWVSRVRQGDRAAFEAIFITYVAPVCSYAYQYARSRAMAEDIVQDVFSSIWARREQWDVHGSVEGYLYASVRYRAMRWKTQAQVEARWSTRLSDEDVVAPAPESDWAVVDAELGTAVARAVAALPPRPREVFTLLRRDHLTHAQVAGRLGISVKTVEIHMGRALKALRKGLSELLS